MQVQSKLGQTVIHNRYNLFFFLNGFSSQQYDIKLVIVQSLNNSGQFHSPKHYINPLEFQLHLSEARKKKFQLHPLNSTKTSAALLWIALLMCAALLCEL